MSSTKRPVVALDLDGVLNPDNPSSDFLRHDVHLPADLVPDSPFVNPQVKQGADLVVFLNPVHGEWITRLRESADVVWATTWEHAANALIAPLLGIEPLEVVEHSLEPAKFSEMKNGDVAHWKLRAIEPAFVGLPLVWVDDDAWYYVNRESGDYFRAGEPTLVIAPDRAGLTDVDRDLIDAFVAANQPV